MVLLIDPQVLDEMRYPSEASTPYAPSDCNAGGHA